MNNNELFEIHKFICNEALELMRKKNHDYSGKSGKEPFANFTRAEAMGITTTEKGMMVRLLDKISRLSTFCDSGEFKVEDEKLKDTIIDSINYSVLLYAYIESKKEKGQMYLDFQNKLPKDVLLLKPEVARRIMEVNPEMDLVAIDLPHKSNPKTSDEDIPDFRPKSYMPTIEYPF
jgi:hypothetical protein